MQTVFARERVRAHVFSCDCRSAAQVGLLPDSYVEFFANQPHHHHHRRHLKPPIINRGTFLRTVAIDAVCHDFLRQHAASERPVQIVSLGAGYDTRYFRLVDELPPSFNNWRYFECDFESVITVKQAIIQEHACLATRTDSLRLIPIDLNAMAMAMDSADNAGNGLSAHLTADFDPSGNTLIIAECCLMYLSARAGDALLDWASQLTAPSVSVCSFDPVLAACLQTDRFAQRMLDNLQDRGLDPQSLSQYPSRESIVARFQMRFSHVTTHTMLDLERSEETVGWVNLEQRQQLNRHAALDEYEEWTLMAEHYLFLLATK